MAKRRKKGSSFTPKAADRHWYGNRQAARVAKSAARTGTETRGPRDAAPSAATEGERARPARSGGAERSRVRPARGAAEVPEMVVGRNPVVEALRAGVPATALYVMSDSSDERIRESIKIAADTGVPLLEAGKPELDRMTDRAVHQGVVLQVPPYEYAHPDDLLTRAGASGGGPPLIVALDGVTDPRNLGAIVRSAAAFGADGVLVPARRSVGVTAGAWKASAGTMASMPVARATNLVRAIKSYKEAGLFAVGLDARGATGVDALEVAADPLVLVIGSEGRGLARLTAENCDMLVNIPIGPGAESLNAGVAAGIALYEIARRRST